VTCSLLQYFRNTTSSVFTFDFCSIAHLLVSFCNITHLLPIYDYSLITYLQSFYCNGTNLLPTYECKPISLRLEYHYKIMHSLPTNDCCRTPNTILSLQHYCVLFTIPLCVTNYDCSVTAYLNFGIVYTTYSQICTLQS
jgi:hypothetical protein